MYLFVFLCDFSRKYCIVQKSNTGIYLNVILAGDRKGALLWETVRYVSMEHRTLCFHL